MKIEVDLVSVGWIGSFLLLFVGIVTGNGLHSLAGVVLAAATLTHMFSKRE